MTTDETAGQDRTSAPIACDLTVFTASEREAHIERAQRLRSAVRGFEMTPDGVEVSFDASVDPGEILAFVQDDQRCCGFISGASGSHESTRHGENFVLRLDASPDAASVWISGFMALRDGVAFDRGGAGRSVEWRLPAAVAGILCLACLLPLAGGLLVARGLVPEAWNLSEGVYLLVGAGVLGLWAALRVLRQRRLRERVTVTAAGRSDTGCGC